MDADRYTLERYVGRAFDDLLGKLDGLSEYDVRRPMTASGTNLLGLVQHVAAVVLEYATLPWGRPRGRDWLWQDSDDEPDVDLRVQPGVSRDDVLRLAADARAGIVELVRTAPLDAPGEVPWWGPGREVTAHRVVVHVVAEVSRHAGHADVLRELLDGTVGMSPGDPDEAGRGEDARAARWERIETDARRAD